MGRLVLSRREGEVVEIRTPTETIMVSVVVARGKNVKLAFLAPEHILFLRQEISSTYQGKNGTPAPGGRPGKGQ